MKNKIFFVICLIASALLVTQCEKYGDKGGPGEPDEDSDRPEWSGGDTDSNPHIKGNDDSGTTRGGDYGDLYILLRDEDNGVPALVEIADEHYVIPVDEYGDELLRYSNVPGEYVQQTDDEELWGELVDPSLVQEVDFGRLNIVRSPESVLSQAYSEALKVLNAPDAVITLDFCGRLTSTYPDLTTPEEDFLVKTIDSPRENMAIYRTIMRDLADPSLAFLDGLDPLMVAAACFAAGSDKTGFVDVDEVVYVNGFMDCYGNYPIENTNELDFEGNPRLYYNFTEPIFGYPTIDFPYQFTIIPFTYDREATFEDRYIQFLVWNNVYYPVDENGDSDGPVFSIFTVFDDLNFNYQGTGDRPQFTYEWGDLLDTGVQGFANAVDDAVQVLDFVHGDSNIRFLPEYEP